VSHSELVEFFWTLMSIISARISETIEGHTIVQPPNMLIIFSEGWNLQLAVQQGKVKVLLGKKREQFSCYTVLSSVCVETSILAAM